MATRKRTTDTKPVFKYGRPCLGLLTIAVLLCISSVRAQTTQPATSSPAAEVQRLEAELDAAQARCRERVKTSDAYRAAQARVAALQAKHERAREVGGLQEKMEALNEWSRARTALKGMMEAALAQDAGIAKAQAQLAAAREALRPKLTVILLDTTGSMTGVFDLARIAARKIVYRMPPQHLVALVVDTGTSGGGTRRGGAPYVLFEPTPATPAAKRAFYERLDTIYPRLAGDLTRALDITLAMKPDVLWLMTDGQPFEKDQAEAHLRRLRESKVRIHILALCQEEQTDLVRTLWQLAHDTGGIYVDRDSRVIKTPPTPPAPPASRAPEPEPEFLSPDADPSSIFQE